MNAYVTLLSENSYIYGVIGLKFGLDVVHSKYPLYVATTPEINETNKQVLKKLGCGLIEIPTLIPPEYIEKVNTGDEQRKILEDVQNLNGNGGGRHRVGAKLHIFGFTQFQKIVYLDADTGIGQNIDDLFNYPHMSAVTNNNGYHFCSGLMVIEPSVELKDKLINLIPNFIARDEGESHDQGLLNYYYNNGKDLGLEIPTYYHKQAPFIGRDHYNWFFHHLQDIRAFHMIGGKPGEYKYNLQEKVHTEEGRKCYGDLYYMYWEFLNWCILKLRELDIGYIPFI